MGAGAIILIFGGPVTIAAGATALFIREITENWMSWIRFYFYSFIHYYKEKGEHWIPWFRSVLLVELTLFSLILLICLLVNKDFLKTLPSARLSGLLFNVILLLVLYQTLVANGRSEKIIEEFQEHPINTKRNRTICWIILVLSLLAPMCVAVINKGYIS